MAHAKLSGLLAACSIAAAACLLAAAPAHAAPANVTETFELDGNVANSGTGKDDWTVVNAGSGSASIVARTGVLADPAPKSIYTGGGSKDDLDLNGALAGAGGWKHKDGSVPDKDNIVNAYATAYNVNGDLVIYAGAERFDNSGDAFMGFWFFKSKISLNANGTFSGQHTVGDVLVLANFQTGGTNVTIQVLEWNPAQATTNGTLKLLAGDTVNSARCGSSVSLLYCGITNPAQGAVGEPPWPYLSKSGTTTFLPATFLEVGINISQVLKQANDLSAPCFATFLAETRASSSVSATLKDFVIGNFDVCGVRITKSCDGGQVNPNGASIDYAFGGKISNVGFGALTNLVLTDTPQAATPAPTVGPISYYKCDALGKPDLLQPLPAGPLAANSDVCYASSFNTSINGSTNTIKVVANTSPTTTTQASSDLATCPFLNIQTGITVDKTCTASLASNGSYLFVKVDISGSVCNTGPLGLTNVAVTDFVAGMAPVGVPVLSTTLGPQGSATACTTYSGSYIPTAPDAGTTTQFSDAVSAEGVPPPITGVPKVTTVMNAGATCNLCPGTQCRAANGATADSLLKQLKLKR
jgi:hypothetical protein